MNQATLIALGWQLAGWLLVAGLPPLIIYGTRLLAAQEKVSTHGQLLFNAVRFAVTAAEQTAMTNPDKKIAALQFAQSYLDSIGVHLPLSLIDDAIESAVFTELNHADPAPAAAKTAPPADAPKA